MTVESIRRRVELARTHDGHEVTIVLPGEHISLTTGEAEKLLDVVDALEDALGALEAHRADMHERSHRPCSTCARSERALEQGGAALARLDGEDTG